MKRPLSIIIISRDPKTQQETHTRYDSFTRFPRLTMLGVMLRALFEAKL